jgi:hypothetical protein
MSRGLRNNNPGNIRRSSARYKGEVHPSRDEEFKEFQSMAYGYRAMFVLLDTYRKRYGLNTIRTMLMRYAPPTENYTTGYIEFVVRHTGIGANTPLNTRHMRDMIPVVAAMSEIENGVAANLNEVEQGWRLFIEG